MRINEHPLMRGVSSEAAAEVVTGAHSATRATRAAAMRRFLRRAGVHVLVFVGAFLVTSGFALLNILLWVRQDQLVGIIALGAMAALLFVAMFAGLRMLILHKLLDEYPNKEEDPGPARHWGKSIAYGFLALVVATILTGLLLNAAAAGAATAS